MKRCFCIFLVLFLLASFLAIPASAECSDSVDAVAMALPMNKSLFPAVMPLDLSGVIECDADRYSKPLVVDYYVTQGKTKIEVTSCTWNPQACDIIIGFFPSDPGAANLYGVRFSGGSINKKTISSVNVPSGTYWIFVYNAGYTHVSGHINYSVSG